MVCDRVSIINRGVLRKLGRVEDLITGGRVEILATNLENGVREKIRVAAPSVSGSSVILPVETKATSPPVAEIAGCPESPASASPS